MNRFLREAWNTEDGRYVNCTYAAFKKNSDIEQLLHKEQNRFCYYCMRYLEISRHTFLEHVIPHNPVNKKRQTSKRSIITNDSIKISGITLYTNI